MKNKNIMSNIANQTKKEKAAAKKAELIAISSAAQALRKAGMLDCSVNEYVLESYTDSENVVFHTYKGWKALGFQVQKGSDSFLIWGKKRKATKKETKEDETENKEFSFFPTCNLFSNAQVEAVEIDHETLIKNCRAAIEKENYNLVYAFQAMHKLPEIQSMIDNFFNNQTIAA